MKIGFTGTQVGMTVEQARTVRVLLRSKIPIQEFHHGDCVGADAQANSFAQMLSIPVVIHPPINKIKRAYCLDYKAIREPKPYLDRNLDIVEETDMLIACPKDTEEQLRSGTWTTLRRARERKKPIYIVFPDGSLAVEND